MKVLSRYVTSGAVRIHVEVEVDPAGGASPAVIDEARIALRELGLPEDVKPRP